MVFNMFIVWFLSGLWHGASWNFVLWGLYFGVFIMMERLFLDKLLSKLPRLISHIYLLIVAVYGWTLFYFTDLSVVIEYTKVLFGLSFYQFIDKATYTNIMSNSSFIILCLAISFGAYDYIVKKLKTLFNIQGNHSENLIDGGQSVLSLSLLILSIFMIVGQSYNPFLYFQF